MCTCNYAQVLPNVYYSLSKKCVCSKSRTRRYYNRLCRHRWPLPKCRFQPGTPARTRMRAWTHTEAQTRERTDVWKHACTDARTDAVASTCCSCHAALTAVQVGLHAHVCKHVLCRLVCMRMFINLCMCTTSTTHVDMSSTCPYKYGYAHANMAMHMAMQAVLGVQDLRGMGRRERGGRGWERR